MSTPRENAPQEAQNIIVMENNIINYDPTYGGGIIVGGGGGGGGGMGKLPKSNVEKRVGQQKVTTISAGGGNSKQQHQQKTQNISVKVPVSATLKTPKSHVATYTTQTIYNAVTTSSPQHQQPPMQVQKIGVQRNVQVVSKTVPNNMIVCTQPATTQRVSGNPTAQIHHQIIEQTHHASAPQSQSPQVFTTTTTHESNTNATQYVPTGTTTVKTIYMNNNTGNLNLNKATTRVNLSPIDYSADNKVITKYATATTARIHAAQQGPGEPQQVIDGGKYAFKFTSSSVALSQQQQQQQQQQPGCNSNTNANNKAKNFNNCNIKQQTQPTTYHYYQPQQQQQQIQYATTTPVATNEATIVNYKVGKSGGPITPIKGQQQQHQQYMHVQQRLPANNYVHAALQGNNGGKSNTNRGKIIIQNAGGAEIVNPNIQHVRYATKNDSVINYNDVISINNQGSASVIQSPMKVRQSFVHQLESSNHDDSSPNTTTCTRVYTVAPAAMDDVDSAGNYNTSNASNAHGGVPYDSYVLVNGSKMSDEMMSAQILHDFSRGASGGATKYQAQTQSGEVIQIAPSPTTIYSSRTQSGGEPQIIWNTTSSTSSPHATNEVAGATTTTVKYVEQRRPSGSAGGGAYQITYHHQQQPTVQHEYAMQQANCDPQQQITTERIIYQQQDSSRKNSTTVYHHPQQHHQQQHHHHLVSQQQQQHQQQQHHHHHQHQDEEEIRGIEIRPDPVPPTLDGKLNPLHAIQQDHTYCQTQSQQQRICVEQTTFSPMNPNLESNTVAAAAVLSSMPGAAKFARSSQQQQQFQIQQQQQHQQHQQMHHTTIPQTQPTHHLQVPTQSASAHYDDDAISTISNGSQDHPLRIDLNNDPGESTETANEGEDEDSETRCICDLTHDDGYMICCDNCSKWQHVDCMKIDRANIPEEYLCVNCSPREVDRQAARTLQLQKRKEQSQLLTYPLQSIYEGTPGKLNITSHGSGIPGTGPGIVGGIPLGGKQTLDKGKNNLSKPRKNSISGTKKSKDPNAKRNKRAESSSRNNGKRKELKRMSKKKLKQLEASSIGGAGSGNAGSTTVPGAVIGTGTTPNAVAMHTTPDKMSTALRGWIESYEVAMTNHYSQELRARLTALGKQQNANADAFPGTELNIGLLNDLVPNCTTVPHAGAKILICTRDIEPNATIIEIRGKYMLANQHKPVQSANSGKKPASEPFLFFYSLPKIGLEVCVNTRTYANEARYVRRSCRPNAEILHTIEKNVIHLYIVAKAKINQNTEITIAHDHNVDPTTRTHSMSHTSTLCACGIVRDCKFAAALATTPPVILTNPTTPPTFPSGPKSRKNGAHGPEKEKRKYKKRNKDGPPKEKPSKEGRSRGRSTSSSCESNTGLMSPPLKNYDDFQRMLPQHQQQQQHQVMLPPETIPSEYTTTTTTTTVVGNHQHETTPSSQTQFFPNHHPNYRHIELPLQHHAPTYSQIDMILAQHMMSSNKSPVKEVVDATTHHTHHLTSSSVIQHKQPPPVPSSHQTAPVHQVPPSQLPQLSSQSPKRAVTPVHSQMAQQVPTPLLSPPPQPPPPKEVMTPPPSIVTTPQKEMPPMIVHPQHQQGAAVPPTLPPLQQQQQPVTQTVIMTSQKVQLDASPAIVQSVQLPLQAQQQQQVEAQIISKSPPLTPQKNNKRIKSQRNSVSHEQTTVVQSLTDESTSSVPTTPVPPKDDEGKAEKENSTEKRKLTREERKVEAYMKAFEKMEKSQQRKQEQKTAKSSPKKPRSAMQKANLVNAQKRKMISQKRKKRKSKTISRKSESKQHSGESDVATSSEETRARSSAAASNLSPLQNYTTPYHPNNYKMSQADLLLSYSQIKSEPDRNLSGIPPLISPACMLIESAIGNLEQTTTPAADSSSASTNEFKFPKTKPKKTIINEWYGDTALKREEHEESSVKMSDSYKVNFKPDINAVAAKVEEFLDRNNVRYGGSTTDDEPLSLVKNEFKPLTTPPQANSPQTEGTSFGSESAVKKRWLRQAISEETAEDLNAAQTEYSTPLKKRRVFIEPQEAHEESQDTVMETKVVVKEESSDAYQSPHSSATLEIKNEDDATVSSTVEETTTGGLLAVSDVQVDDAGPQLPVESELASVSEIVKEVVEGKAGKEDDVLIDEDNKSSNSEEMAEYQKVIASFHSENIMILQTRNKKSKSFSGEMETSKVPAKLTFDDDESQLTGTKRLAEDEPPVPPKQHRTRSPSPESTSVTESAPILAQTLTSATVPEPRHVTETIPFGGSRYLNNIRTTDEVPSILSTAPPVVLDEIPPSAPPFASTMQHLPFAYRPMMTNLTMGEYPDTTAANIVNVSVPPPALPPPPPGVAYLASYNKATFITDPKVVPIVEQYTASAYPGTFASAVAASDQVPQTSFLGKSYSTLNDGATFYSQKIFTKTSSSDPRLNPNLNPPEEVKPSPIPKKKLSLTEYRKRKAQSTDSISNDGFASDTNSAQQSSDLPAEGSSPSKDASKSCDDATAKTNPSPTNSTDDIAAESTTNQSLDDSAGTTTTDPTSISDSSDTLDMFDDAAPQNAGERKDSDTPEVSSSTQIVHEPQSTTTESQSEQSAGEEK